MEYKIQETDKGNFEVAISNPSFGWAKVYTFDTINDARLFVEGNKEANRLRLAEVKTISEYFNS